MKRGCLAICYLDLRYDFICEKNKPEPLTHGYLED